MTNLQQSVIYAGLFSHHSVKCKTPGWSSLTWNWRSNKLTQECSLHRTAASGHCYSILLSYRPCTSLQRTTPSTKSCHILLVKTFSISPTSPSTFSDGLRQRCFWKVEAESLNRYTLLRHLAVLKPLGQQLDFVGPHHASTDAKLMAFVAFLLLIV